jgi:hypothetical protein
LIFIVEFRMSKCAKECAEPTELTQGIHLTLKT